MNKKNELPGIGAGLLMFFAFAIPAAHSQVSVSVDMDTVAPGIQSTRIASPGNVFTVDLIMSVGAGGVSSYGVSSLFDNIELALSGSLVPTDAGSAAKEATPASLSNFTPGVAEEANSPVGHVYSFEAGTLATGPSSTSFSIGTISFSVLTVANDGVADITPGLFNFGIDGVFDNAGNPVTPTINPGYVISGNTPPVAPNQTFTRAPGVTLKIKIADVLAACSDPDGGTPALDSVGASVQGATISTTATHILYTLASNAGDSFPYTIRDGQGGTTTGTITVQVVTPGGLVQSITVGAGITSVTVNFAGIPGFEYNVQRTTDTAVPWVIVDTQTAPIHGLFSYTDPDPPHPKAFYRLMQPIP